MMYLLHLIVYMYMRIDPVDKITLSSLLSTHCIKGFGGEITL